jgi:hypothetical protein
MECALKNKWDLNKMSDEEAEEFLNHADFCDYHAGLLEGFNRQALPEIQAVLHEFIIQPPNILLDKKIVYKRFALELLNDLIGIVKFPLNLLRSAYIVCRESSLANLVMIFVSIGLIVSLVYGAIQVIGVNHFFALVTIDTDFPTSVTPTPLPKIPSSPASIKKEDPVAVNPPVTKKPRIAERNKSPNKPKSNVSILVQEQSIDEAQINQKQVELKKQKRENGDNASESSPQQPDSKNVVKTPTPIYSVKDRYLDGEPQKGQIVFIVEFLNLSSKQYQSTDCKLIMEVGSGIVLSTKVTNEGTCIWRVNNNQNYVVNIENPNYKPIVRSFNSESKVTSILQVKLERKEKP